MSYQSEQTKERILAAAEAVFADYGFHRTTVREIVYKAGVNLAAVNYHFGGKEALYELALKNAVAKLHERLIDIPEVPDDPEAAQESLKEFLAGMALRGLTMPFTPPGEKLLGWEILSPTGQIQKLLPSELGPKIDRMGRVIERIRGKDMAERDRRVFALWVLGQALHFTRFGPMLQILEGGTLSETDAHRYAADLAECTVRGLSRRGA